MVKKIQLTIVFSSPDIITRETEDLIVFALIFQLTSVFILMNLDDRKQVWIVLVFLLDEYMQSLSQMTLNNERFVKERTQLTHFFFFNI